MVFPRTLGALLMLAPALAAAQTADTKPDEQADAVTDDIALVGSVFVTGATVMDLCGDDGSLSGDAEESQACQALVMGLFNGFLYGATYGAFVTCVPEDVGADQIVRLFTAYVRAEGPEEWNHAGNMMGYLLEDQGGGGIEGEACLGGSDQDADASPQPASAASDTDDHLSTLVADADPATGQQVYRMCSSCHATQEGGPNLIGPHLWQTVDRPIASVDGFPYSDALDALGMTGRTWDLPLLSDYLENPLAAVPGTTMVFRGVRDENDRLNLLAYLASLTGG